MKILMAHEVFPPEANGGGEILFSKFAEELKKRGHTVTVLTSGNPKIKSYHGIKTIRIPVNRYLMNLSYPIIKKYAKDFDLIQTSSGNMAYPSWKAGKKLNKPVVCYIHHIFGDNWIDVRGRLLGRIFRFMERFILKRDYNFMLFQNISSMEIAENKGIDLSDYTVVHPPVDFKRFDLRLKREPFILTVGNLNMDKPTCKIKDIERMIYLSKMMYPLKFVIVGKGSYLDELKKTVFDNVIFAGKVTGKPLAELYNKASVYLCLSFAEGFGLSQMEAMASGCPVVSTIDLLQSGTKIKPRKYFDALLEIMRYMNDKKLARKDGRYNKNIAKGFTWDKFMDEMLEIYEGVL